MSMINDLIEENSELKNRVAELERALGGMLFGFDDGVGRDWSAPLLDYARTLTHAVEFKSRAKSVEVGHE